MRHGIATPGHGGEMKGLLLRGGLLVAAILAASVAYYLAAGLAIALPIATAVALLAVAFVAAPVSLVSGANSRQSTAAASAGPTRR